jgi:hypothetical protein
VVTGTRGRGAGSGDGSGSLFLEDWNGAEPENGFANDDDKKDDEADVFERDKEFFGLDEDEEPVGKRLDGNPNKEDDEPGRPLTPDLDENGTPIKRRKVDSSLPDGSESQSAASTVPPSKQSGPFIDESDSEGEDLSAFQEVEEGFTAPAKEDSATFYAHERRSPVDVPPLVREATSHVDDDEYAGFDDAEEHEFREEESLEPLVDEECRLDKDGPNNILDTPDEESNGVDICPICQRSLVGLNEEVSFTRLYMIQY